MQEIKYFITSISGDDSADSDDDREIRYLGSQEDNDKPLYSTFGTIPCKTIQENNSEMLITMSTGAIIAEGPLIIKKTDKDAVKAVSIIQFNKLIHNILINYFKIK